MVYTNESPVLVSNAKNILINEGLSISVRNEHSSTGGHANFAFMELWVDQDRDYEKAISLLTPLGEESSEDNWHCSICEEENDPSFEVCWKCNGDATSQ
jgi:hypothetical protein